MFSSNTSQVSNDAVYVEDVVSTYLYAGTGSTLSIPGPDFATYGGLAWIKNRTYGYDNCLFDTARGANKLLISNSTQAQANSVNMLNSFNSSGFTLGTDGYTGGAVNVSGSNYVAWQFRKQPKFFDVVTYTGTGSVQNIAHNLGSTPGCIIVKSLTYADYWVVYHRGANGGVNPEQYGFYLNDTSSQFSGSVIWNNTAPTSTQFTLGTYARNNTAGQTYVAYLFAHDAGGFGLTGTDNVISCGSYTGNGSTTGPVVTLGYEPQWLMVKRTDDVDDWNIADNMRGLFVGDTSTTANSPRLRPNLSNAEQASGWVIPTATGFQLQGPNAASGSYNASGGKYIYIAIRRGPMKVPTSGTSVFAPVAYTGNGSTQTATTGFPVDAMIEFERTNSSGDPAAGGKYMTDRLRGSSAYLETSSTGAESTGFVFGLDSNTGIKLSSYFNSSPRTYIIEAFRRAPSFFDEVCYTGTGTESATAHNLGVVPELIITKCRSYSPSQWIVGSAADWSKYLVLNQTAAYGASTSYTSLTSTSYTPGSGLGLAWNGQTFVAYLFATCAGVSKVGSYTGTGTTLQVDCGFTGGARFVLIKRTDSTGDWYVWDTARGMVAGNDPYLLLNSTAAEVTNTDYVDTYSAGFEISSTAPAAINASGGTFIFLAIA